jgi:hypothetical protein
MSGWTQAELDEIGGAREVRVAGERAGGSLRNLVVVWQVRVDDDLYLRSVRGPEGGWYRGVLDKGRGRLEAAGVSKDVVFERSTDHEDEIDAAYRAKYGRGSSVDAITAPRARETTLRVSPSGD